MKIAVDFGHGTGQDRGAEGYLNEERVIREYGPLVIEGLKQLGHTVINVTPTQPNLTLGQSLAYRVNAANRYNVDLFVSFHVNAFEKDKANGCEVEYISSTGKTYADRMCSEIATLLGYRNRGSQFRNNLYVLKYTAAPAILVEPFFCDTKEDCNKYDKYKLANAIVKAITGKNIPQKPMVEDKKVPEIDHGIPNQIGVLPFGNSFGYIQSLSEKGRIDIHLDRYNYLTIQDDPKDGNRVFITTRTKGSKELI